MAFVEDVQITDVPVSDVWSRLKDETNSLLIDVRTRAEWAFVGLPDLSELGKGVLTVEWQTFPDNRIDPEFAGRLADQLDRMGTAKEAELFFICRSGGRSRMAAEVMAAAGYSKCFNVADGFEGPLDASTSWTGRGLEV